MYAVRVVRGVLSRYSATIRMVSGAYKSAFGDTTEVQQVIDRVTKF